MANQSRIDLTQTLYGELRKLAAARMSTQFEPQTLQATALLHEAWLRLGGEDQPEWESRAHFYNAVAAAMRHILVDRARRRQSVRRGGGCQRAQLDTLNWERLTPSQSEENDKMILVVNDAMERLENEDPPVAELINLRYFVGLSVADAAGVLKLSLRTAERRLAYARSWLALEIKEAISA